MRRAHGAALALVCSACSVVHTPGPTVDTKPDTAQATIGASGGTLSTPDAILTVTVPPAAVAHDVTFTVGPTAAPLAGALGKAFEVGPAGTQFAVPVSIAVHYATEDLGDAQASGLIVATVAGGNWQPLAAEALDRDASIATGQTMHLSPFALVQTSSIVAPSDGGPDAEAGATQDSGTMRDAGAIQDAAEGGPADATSDGSETGRGCSDDRATTGTCSSPARPLCSTFPGTFVIQCENNPASGGYAAICCAPDGGDGG